MDLKRLDEIVESLKVKNVDQPCPRCGHEEFTALAESYLPIAGTGGWFAGDVTIPVALIACKQCGWLSHHALSTLESKGTPTLSNRITVGEMATVGVFE